MVPYNIHNPNFIHDIILFSLFKRIQHPDALIDFDTISKEFESFVV